MSILLATKRQSLTLFPSVLSTNPTRVSGIGREASTRIIDISEISLIALRVISSCHCSKEFVPGVSIIRNPFFKMSDGNVTRTWLMESAYDGSVV